MSSVSAWLALVRWPNALIAASAVLVGAWWTAALIDARVVLTALAALGLTATANAANDIADVDIDRLAHPRRPIAAGAISPASARRFAVAAALAALIALALVHWTMAALTVPVVGVMWIYSRWLKHRGLPGNVAVAVLASLPFLYGAWVVGRARDGLLLVAMAMPLHFAREVAKDLDDARADDGARRTLPLARGVATARRYVRVAVMLFALLVMLIASRYPVLALLLMPTVALAVTATQRLHASVLPQRLFKVAMVCAIAALVISRS